MKVAIMQPYFLPYLGYFQLIEAVDVFIIYDNVEYTKKGWLTRNRFLLNGEDVLFSIPVAKGPDHALIRDRELSAGHADEVFRIKRRMEAAYRKAPFFQETWPLVDRVFTRDGAGLFEFIFFSVREVMAHLQIDTTVVVSSTLDIDPRLRHVDRVIAICEAVGGGHYINPIGGKELYSIEHFQHHGMQLSFLRSRLPVYPQFDHDFVPGLSILDVMMFNGVERTRLMLPEYDLV